jgi:ABC-type nickel/cobalt efflux system permease component RcnA
MFIDYAFLRKSFVIGLTHGLEPAHGIVAVALLFLGVRAMSRHVCFFGLSAFVGQFFGVVLLGLVTWAGSGESGVRDAVVRNAALGLKLGGAALVLAIGWRLWQTRSAAGDSAAPAGWTPFWCALALGQAVGLLQCRIMLPSLVLSFGQRQAAQGIVGVGLFALGLALVLTVAALLAAVTRRRIDAVSRVRPWPQRVPLVARGLLMLAGVGLALQALIAH